MGNDLTNLAELVAIGSTIRDAAEQIGITETKGYNLSRKPEFKAEVARIRTEKTEGLSALALGGAEDALVQLRAIATTAERDSDRIAACRVLLDKAVAFAEMTEFRRRLDELERNADEASRQAGELASV